MAKKKTYAAVMEDMSKKLRTYQTRLQEAQQRGDTVGMQDYGRRIQRVQAGMETLFNTQEASKQPQPTMQMGHGGIPRYGDGTSDTEPTTPNFQLGLRQFNPGNLRSWGDNPVENGFAKFETLQDGYNALVKQLRTYQGFRTKPSSSGVTGNSTLAEAMAAYAPASENNTAGYIDRLVDYLNRSGENVTADTKIKDIPTDKWASSIALVESPQAYASLERNNLLQPDVKKALANDRAVVNSRAAAEAFQQQYPDAFTTTAQPDETTTQSGPRTTPSPEPDVAPRAQQPNQAQLNLQQQAEQDARDVTSTAPIPGQSALERQIAATAEAMRRAGLDPTPGVLNPIEPEYNPDFRPGYEGSFDPTAPLDGGFRQGNRQYFPLDPLAGLGTRPSPEFLRNQELQSLTDADFTFEEPVFETRELDGITDSDFTFEDPVFETRELDGITDADFTFEDPIDETSTTRSGAVTPEQRAQYEAAEAQVDAERAAAKQAAARQAEVGNLSNLFGQLVPEQNKLAQFGQFLPDLYAAYQMEKVGRPVDMPSQTMARMNTDVNYNPIYAQARQQLAQENTMIDRNVSNPVVAAALKRSAANQAQSAMGQTMASEIDQERQLANQYAQSIAQNKNINAQIAAQNQQQQVDFENQKRAARANMLQQAGVKMGQIYGENQNRAADIQKLGLSSLMFEGDMLGRMGTNLEALRAAGLLD
jgi:hypothetical protein